MTALGHGAFVLSGDCIAVWSLRTDVSAATAAKFEPFLSADEKERAARCRIEGLRVTFSVTRGALRYLLGRYLKLHPELIRFKYGPKGKPALALDMGIEFNTTHSGDLAAFAFAADCEVGIDLEKIRQLPEMEDIADRFFSRNEAIELMSLAPEQRLVAFYRCWTRKEAYLKAVGCGLSAPLDEFRVSLTADETTPLIRFDYDRDAVKPWTLHDLSVGPDYAGALAYRDRPRFISLFPTIDPIGLFDLAGH